ncbi:Gfo/Idh/MocA family protein [Motiliproteus sp. MSK22-1]|uniref:Gfo/Idh/MocA family protein n=1 Tax=Motiliproteus sp. MSK22-1 TaxID=1897630 RepID=UPI0009758EA4|nr:Gfo/Idh/MocA family oxidoreductase [Motiliproteus sp. MSK22-1]OMH29433.1 fructose reductase [Motiliproteus sp. MSK22-1]
MKTGWGFIGASTIAKQWMIDAVRAQRGHDVVAVMSSDLARGQAYADANQIGKAYDLVEALLADEEVNAVYVSTTNELHKDQVLAAAAAGKHVLCEKPLAVELNDAVEMVIACRKAGVVMGTNHHLRNAATHQAIRQQIESGVIGNVVGMRIFHAVELPGNLQTWRINKPQAGGGVILDIVVHDADTVRYLLGEDPVDVMAYAQNGGMASGLEDGSMTIMRMPNGALVQSHESFVVPHAGTGLEVHGTKGSIFARGVMTQKPVGEVEVVTDQGRRFLDIDHHNLYVHSLAKFATAIEDGGEAAVTGVDGIKSLAVALAVSKSAAEGRRVEVNYPDIPPGT